MKAFGERSEFVGREGTSGARSFCSPSVFPRGLASVNTKSQGNTKYFYGILNVRHPVQVHPTSDWRLS